MDAPRVRIPPDLAQWGLATRLRGILCVFGAATQARAQFAYCSALVAVYPLHCVTGRRGYFGNARSLADNPHK